MSSSSGHQPGRLLRSWAARVTLILIVGSSALTASAPSAWSAEIYPRPADGVFQLTGHGFGHGRGMSQWGAQGAALRGLTYAQILAFYYRGTALVPSGNGLVRVSLSADPARLRVSPTSGLSVVDAAGVRTVLPAGPTQWQLVPVGSALQLQAFSGSWSAYPVGGSTALASPVMFVSNAPAIRAWRADDTSTDYRGSLAGYASGGQVSTVSLLLMEDYLRGVVPRESPAWFAPAALQAQATAARTYALAKVRASGGGGTSDLCDTTSCQVFAGTTSYSASGVATALEQPSTDAAVQATAGVTLSYGGAPIVAEYSSSSGGWTAAGSQPYLAADEDPYDAVAPQNTHASWNAVLPASVVESAYPSIGVLQRMVVVSRNGFGDWGGRVQQVRFEGSTGSVTASGEEVRFLRPYPANPDGFHSAWFTVLNADPSTLPPVLAVGESVSSPSGSFRLIMQGDGNLVVYNAAGRAIWATMTFVPGSYLAAQRDGNLVLYDPYGSPVWATMTVRWGAYTKMQDDGNLVVYSSGGPLWDSYGNTGARAVYFVPRRRVWTLKAGETARSWNGDLMMAMQVDGNFVTYYRGVATWATMTFTPGSWMVVQDDGNLVVYRPSGRPAWATMTLSAGAALYLRDDGNAVLYSSAGGPLWDSAGSTGRSGVRDP